MLIMLRLIQCKQTSVTCTKQIQYNKPGPPCYDTYCEKNIGVICQKWIQYLKYDQLLNNDYISEK